MKREMIEHDVASQTDPVYELLSADHQRPRGPGLTLGIPKIIIMNRGGAKLEHPFES
jgi:hypothetical protein